MQPFQCGRSRSDRWSPVTDSLFETPTLDDPRSSRIERDIMRRRPCANGWLVDRCPGPRPPELVLDLRRLVGDATVWPPRRSTILSPLSDRPPAPISARKGRATGKTLLDPTAVLMDRSPDPPVPAATVPFPFIGIDSGVFRGPSLVRPSKGILHRVAWSEWKGQTASAYRPLPLSWLCGGVIACERERHRDVALFRLRLSQSEAPMSLSPLRGTSNRPSPTCSD